MADKHLEKRRAVWRKLLNDGGNYSLMKATVAACAAAEGVPIVSKTHHWEMTLLGRRASCTSTADGVLSNWADARLKEFGRG